MKKKLKWLLLSICMLAFAWSLNLPTFAAGTKTSNMVGNCDPYYLNSATIEESFNMGGTTYTNGLKFKVGYDRTAQAHFHLGGNYSSISFEVGHVDGGETGSSDIVMQVLAEETKVLKEVSLNNTDLPKAVSIQTTGIQQLTIKFTARYYYSHFGIGAINLVGSQPSVRVKPSNMVGNCEPYSMSSAAVKDSFDMGGTTYTDGLRFTVAYYNTPRVDFNFDGNYSSMSFEVGHIDGESAGSSDIVMKILKEGSEVVREISFTNTEIPKTVEVSLAGVHQLTIVWSSRYYTSYFGIGAINLKSNGIVRGITLDKEVLELSAGNPSAYLRATVIPNDAADTNVTWKSADTRIATVDSNGLVRGVSSGTVEITATTASGNYSASCMVKVDMPADLQNASVTLSNTAYTYDGKAKEPDVTVKYNDVVLTEGRDYTVTYESNVKAGTGIVIVAGRNNYSGTIRKSFQISKANPSNMPVDLQNASVTLSNTAYTYDGKAKEPDVTVKYSGVVLTEGQDYTVTYESNIKAGTGIVKIAGRNNYSGTIRKSFQISKANQSIKTSKGSYRITLGGNAVSLEASAKTSLTYATSANSVATVNESGKVKPVKAGVVTITIKAAESSNYNASSTKVKVTVIPKKVKLYKPTSTTSRTMKVKWKKAANVSGYEIQYSKKKSFSSRTAVTVNKKTATSKTIKKLEKRKTYYVRIRSYVKTSSGKIYSDYSSVQKVKIK